MRSPLGHFAKLPRVRPAVDWLGQRTYSVYLWHMHCFVLAWFILAAAGWLPTIQGMPAPLTRLVYFAACLAVTLPVVAVTSKAGSRRLPLDRVRSVRGRSRAV